MTTTHDHRENIKESAESQTEYLREYKDLGDALNEYILEAERFVSNNGRKRFEFTLTIGGPTVWVVVDEWQNVTFHNSWGTGSNGQPLEQIELIGSLADTWIELANYYDEAFPEVE